MLRRAHHLPYTRIINVCQCASAQHGPKCRSLQHLEVRALKYRCDGWQTGGRTFVYLARVEKKLRAKGVLA